MQLLPDRYYAAVEQRHNRRAKNIRLPTEINQKEEKEKRQKKIMTNAEKIRNMSDEELADWLHNMCDFEKDEEPYKSIYNLDTEKEEEIHDSYGDLLNWLQAE